MFSELCIVAAKLNKSDYLEEDSLYFLPLEDHVQEVSKKWYKSVKKLVKHLMEVVGEVPEYEERKDLVIVRATFVWISQNMR